MIRFSLQTQPNSFGFACLDALDTCRALWTVVPVRKYIASRQETPANRLFGLVVGDGSAANGRVNLAGRYPP
jgi:hypothetical protein